MWSKIVNTTEKKEINQHLKKKIKNNKIVSSINSVEDYFEIKYSGDLLDHFINLENYFDENIISILDRNGVSKEYDFIELIKNNVMMDNKKYYEFLKLLESEGDDSDEDIICK